MGGRLCAPNHIPHNIDLLDFPTLIFGQTGYSTYVLRQASRRSWRIGQRRPVKVKFLQYTGTMQESCLRLMGKKLLVSLAMEGKFAAEGLQALEDDDDMLTAMAGELVTQKGVGEKADACWREVQKQYARLLESQRIRTADQSPKPTVAVGVTDRRGPAPQPSLQKPEALVELATARRTVARLPRYTDDAQLPLAF